MASKGGGSRSGHAAQGSASQVPSLPLRCQRPTWDLVQCTRPNHLPCLKHRRQCGEQQHPQVAPLETTSSPERWGTSGLRIPEWGPVTSAGPQTCFHRCRAKLREGMTLALCGEAQTCCSCEAAHLRFSCGRSQSLKTRSRSARQRQS